MHTAVSAPWEPIFRALRSMTVEELREFHAKWCALFVRSEGTDTDASS